MMTIKITVTENRFVFYYFAACLKTFTPTALTINEQKKIIEKIDRNGK